MRSLPTTIGILSWLIQRMFSMSGLYSHRWGGCNTSTLSHWLIFFPGRWLHGTSFTIDSSKPTLESVIIMSLLLIIYLPGLRKHFFIYPLDKTLVWFNTAGYCHKGICLASHGELVNTCSLEVVLLPRLAFFNTKYGLSDRMPTLWKFISEHLGWDPKCFSQILNELTWSEVTHDQYWRTTVVYKVMVFLTLGVTCLTGYKGRPHVHDGVWRSCRIKGFEFRRHAAPWLLRIRGNSQSNHFRSSTNVCSLLNVKASLFCTLIIELGGHIR